MLGVVNGALVVDALAEGGKVRRRGWGSPSMPRCGQRGSVSNAQRSKESVRSENIPSELCGYKDKRQDK